MTKYSLPVNRSMPIYLKRLRTTNYKEDPYTRVPAVLPIGIVYGGRQVLFRGARLLSDKHVGGTRVLTYEVAIKGSPKKATWKLRYIDEKSTPGKLYYGPAPKGYMLGGDIMKEVTLIEAPDGTRNDGHIRTLRTGHQRGIKFIPNHQF